MPRVRFSEKLKRMSDEKKINYADKLRDINFKIQELSDNFLDDIDEAARILGVDQDATASALFRMRAVNVLFLRVYKPVINTASAKEEIDVPEDQEEKR